MRVKQITVQGNVIAINIRKPPYTCPRCGYRVARKIDMQCHFNCKTRGPCNGIVNDITLTDHIKNTVLENRIYVVQSEELLSIAASNVTHNENSVSLVASNVSNTENLVSVATGNVTRNENLVSVTASNMTQNHSYENESENETY